MSRKLALPVLLAAASFLLVGCAGDSEQKKKSLSAFAVSSCASVVAADEAEEAVSTSRDQLGSMTSGPEQHAFGIEQIEGFIEVLEEQKATAEKAVPLVDDGEKISKSFVDYWQTRIDWSQSVLDEFPAEVPDWGRNQDKVTLYVSPALGDLGVAQMGPDIRSPFAELEDQDVIKALDDEPSCDDIVMVF